MLFFCDAFYILNTLFHLKLPKLLISTGSDKYQCTGDWEKIDSNTNLSFTFQKTMSILLQTILDLAIWETFIWTWNVYLSTYIQLPSWHLFFDVCHLKLNVIWSSPPGPKLASSTVFLISEDGWHLSNCSGREPCRHHWPCLSHTCFMKALYKTAPYLHLLLSPLLTLLQLPLAYLLLFNYVKWNKRQTNTVWDHLYMESKKYNKLV